MPRKRAGDKTPGSGVVRHEAVPPVVVVSDDDLDLVTTERLVQAIGRRSSVYVVASVPMYGRRRESTDVWYGSASRVAVIDAWLLGRRLVRYLRALAGRRTDVDKIEAELGD